MARLTGSSHYIRPLYQAVNHNVLVIRRLLRGRRQKHDGERQCGECDDTFHAGTITQPNTVWQRLTRMIDLCCGLCYFSAHLAAMNTALNQHVLVLNRLWQAVNVCTVRRALTLLFQGQAQVVVTPKTARSAPSTFRNGAIFPRMHHMMNPSTPFLSASACRASFCCSSTTGCRKRSEVHAP